MNDCPQMVLAVVSWAADFTDFAESAVLSTLPRPTVDFENVAHVGAPEPFDLRYYPEVPAPVGA